MVRNRLTLIITSSFMLVIGKSPYEGVPNVDMLSHLQEGGRLLQPDGCSDTW